jgi:hypothetical protein
MNNLLLDKPSFYWTLPHVRHSLGMTDLPSKLNIYEKNHTQFGMNEVACDWFKNNNALILTSELIYKQMWSHIYDSPAKSHFSMII